MKLPVIKIIKYKGDRLNLALLLKIQISIITTNIFFYLN